MTFSGFSICILAERSKAKNANIFLKKK